MSSRNLKSSFRRKPESKNTDDTGPRLSPGRRERLDQNDEKSLNETSALRELLSRYSPRLMVWIRPQYSAD